MSTNLPTTLELDERRRASLGRIGRPEHRLYLASEAPDGTITLKPCVVMSESEARLHDNHELVARIEANRTDPSRLVTRKPKPSRTPPAH